MRDPLSVWRSPMWRLLSALMLGAVLSLWAAHAVHGQQASDPAVIWGRFVDALNRGDAAGAAGVFAEDAIFQQANGACASPCAGRAAIVPALQQLVAGRPAFNTLPGAQILAGNYVGRLRSASAASVTTVPFTMAAAGESIEALRFDSATVSGLMSAGTGGLIRLAPVGAGVIGELLIGGGLLAGVGFVLLVLSGIRTHAMSDSTVGRVAMETVAETAERWSPLIARCYPRKTGAVWQAVDRALSSATARLRPAWFNRGQDGGRFREHSPPSLTAVRRYMLPRAPA